MEHIIKIKRIYDDPSDGDGLRVLVDRIWPRGMTKEKAEIDDWMKELAPSTELRKWFNHDPDKFASFKENYRSFLKENEQCQKKLKELKESLKDGNVTLLYGAKDEKHNQAVVLKQILQEIE